MSDEPGGYRGGGDVCVDKMLAIRKVMEKASSEK